MRTRSRMKIHLIWNYCAAGVRAGMSAGQSARLIIKQTHQSEAPAVMAGVTRKFRQANVRFGSKADVRTRSAQWLLLTQSGHSADLAIGVF
jgi:hypothetical protein